MKTIYGLIWSVAGHTGWSFDYIMDEVRWPIIKRMIADAPVYNSPKKKESNKSEKTNVQSLTDDSLFALQDKFSRNRKK